MNRSVRLAFILGGVCISVTARPASAQYFGGGFGVNVPGRLPVNPLNFYYQSSFRFAVGSGLGPGVSFGYNFSGPVGYALMQRYRYPQQPYFSTPSYGGYMTGGVRTPTAEAAARNFAYAQQQAAAAIRNNPVAARSAIYDQWAYEKLGVVGVPGVKSGDDAPEALLKALNNASEADIASGEALNHIVVGVVAAEKKGKANSAFLPPNLLAKVRFAGPPAADAINLLRQAGALVFPVPFEDSAFENVRPAIEKDFAAVAGPVLLGKVPDPVRVGKLDADVAKARAILDPITKNFEFEDAAAARRMLNNLNAVVYAVKGAGGSGLIDPRWASEGTSVADLVKHMMKNKLLFGPAVKGDEDAYIALHRGLAAYLFVLNESQKPAPKK
jgi:hypothetical protein